MLAGMETEPSPLIKAEKEINYYAFIRIALQTLLPP